VALFVGSLLELKQCLGMGDEDEEDEEVIEVGGQNRRKMKLEEKEQAGKA